MAYRYLSKPLPGRALIISLPQGNGDWGPTARRGGGNVRDIIAVTSGCPQDNPQTPLRWSPVTCRRHVPIVYSLHDPRGLTSSRIRLLTNLSCSTIVSL